jgi:hypothetical protein
MTWERVLAKDIRPGDLIARTRKTPPVLVTAVTFNPVSVWLTLHEDDGQNRSSLLVSARGYRIRPGYDQKFWKAVE